MAPSERRLVITIDGPAGAGKSTVAKRLAHRLDYAYLDTGALYRAVAWKVKNSAIDMSHPDQIIALMSSIDLHLTFVNGEVRVLIDSEDVTRHLRTPEISGLASSVAALSSVREWLLPIQRKFGEQGGIVAEGRDMGTRVFPNSDAKFFLDADVEIRSKRRYQDSLLAGHDVDPTGVRQEIMSRDARDRSRTVAPLHPAPDAVVIDSSTLTVEEVVDTIMGRISAAP